MHVQSELRTDLNLLLLTEVAFLQSNIGQHNLFKKTINTSQMRNLKKIVDFIIMDVIDVQ